MVFRALEHRIPTPIRTLKGELNLISFIRKKLSQKFFEATRRNVKNVLRMSTTTIYTDAVGKEEQDIAARMW